MSDPINQPLVALQNSSLMKEIAALRNGIMRAQYRTDREDIQQELTDTLDAANAVRRGFPS